jgi:hypothetical protein
VTSNEDSRVAGTHDWLGERVILAGRNKDVEERNVTISFSQSPERATATRGRVQLVDYTNKMFDNFIIFIIGVIQYVN